VLEVKTRDSKEGMYMCLVAKAVVYNSHVPINRYQQVSAVLKQSLDHPVSSRFRLVIFVKGCTTERSLVEQRRPFHLAVQCQQTDLI
jgi:hypothetical protein